MNNQPSELWRPTATLEALKARARLNRAIREFFAARDVMEVETPLLCASTATDPHLVSFSLEWRARRYFLQTSPEFCMKRLLAAGSGAVYQLGKAFRADEVGRYHNPEFSLLEWYRPGFDLAQLMDETEELVRELAILFGRDKEAGRTADLMGCDADSSGYDAALVECDKGLVARRLSYREVFLAATGVDPLLASNEELAALAKARVKGAPDEWDRDGWLNLLMSHVVEPSLPEGLCFVWGFPPSQASLAVCVPDGDGAMVAARVELYVVSKEWGAVELANGYQELTDAAEQRRRCEEDVAMRQVLGGEAVPLPSALLDALGSGMPCCSGIALGVDRLLMWLLRADAMAGVCAFPADRA